MAAARAWVGPVGPRGRAGLFGRVLASRPALLEQVALAVHFQNMDMVSSSAWKFDPLESRDLNRLVRRPASNLRAERHPTAHRAA